MADSTSQSYSNHRKFVPMYHYVLTLILVVNLGWSVWMLIQNPGFATVLGVALALALAGIFLFARTFPLGVQDRLIRLEETLRCREILPEDLKSRLGELRVRQFVALRFASDDELADRVREALDEKLGGEQIKKRIQSWRADHDRI